MAGYTVSDVREYLIREQGYDEEVVKNIPKEELRELWEHYHED